MDLRHCKASKLLQVVWNLYTYKSNDDDTRVRETEEQM